MSDLNLDDDVINISMLFNWDENIKNIDNNKYIGMIHYSHLENNTNNNIEKQKKIILDEQIKRRNAWLNRMENNILIPPNDSIISMKLLVCEAFRRNQTIKKKYHKLCRDIFEKNTDPNVIKSLIQSLPLFMNTNNGNRKQTKNNEKSTGLHFDKNEDQVQDLSHNDDMEFSCVVESDNKNNVENDILET